MQLSIENILPALEQLDRELSAETRLVRIGSKAKLETSDILTKYDWLCQKDVLSYLDTKVQEATDGDTRERTERLYFAITELYLYRQVAPEVDKLETALSSKVVSFEGAEIPYYNLHPRLQNEDSFEAREKIGALVDDVHAEFTPQKLQVLKSELTQLTDELKFDGYIEYLRLKKQFKYPVLIKRLEESLATTAAVYRRHIRRWTEKKIGKPFGKLNRYHVSYLMKHSDFDHYFPKESLVETVHTTLRHMGVDLQKMTNIKLDIEERPKKNPRAFCSPDRIPEEVWLVIKPNGGIVDYETFLHEAGHALHFGCSNPELSYEYRHLSRSYALSEIYSFLMQNLVQDVGWLRAAMKIDEKTAATIRYYMILTDLYMYRRYIGKFTAEYEFFQQDDLHNGQIYANRLTNATGFIYKPGGYLFDMDNGLYSADYLRAWLGEAQLREHLQREYGAAWWANAAVGEFLKGLWNESSRIDAEQLVAQIGAQPLDTGPLERRFAELDQLADYLFA